MQGRFVANEVNFSVVLSKLIQFLRSLLCHHIKKAYAISWIPSAYEHGSKRFFFCAGRSMELNRCWLSDRRFLAITHRPQICSSISCVWWSVAGIPAISLGTYLCDYWNSQNSCSYRKPTALHLLEDTCIRHIALCPSSWDYRIAHLPRAWYTFP